MNATKRELLKRFRYPEETGKSQYIYAHVDDILAFLKEYKHD